MPRVAAVSCSVKTNSGLQAALGRPWRSSTGPNFMTLFRFPPRLMVLQVGRSTSTGKSSEARSANGLKWSRVSSQARIKIPCSAQPDALTTIPRWQPPGGPAPGAGSRSTSALVEPAVGAAMAAPAARTPTPASANRPTTPSTGTSTRYAAAAVTESSGASTTTTPPTWSRMDPRVEPKLTR